MASIRKPRSKHSRTAEHPYPLDDAIGYLLGRAFQAGHRNLHAALAELQLTPQQHVILMRLAEVGTATTSEAGRWAGMKPATAHGIVHRLEQRGLIRLTADPEDRRVRSLGLTRAGKALIPVVAERARAAALKSLAPLTQAERAALKEMLQKLIGDSA